MRRLPSKRWQAFYTGPDTHLHYASSTFSTSEDAEAWLADERRIISGGEWSSPRARAEVARVAEQRKQSRLFGAYANAWLESRHHLRASTRTSYSKAIRRHLVPAFGTTALSDVSPDMVREWFASYGTRTPTARAHAYQVLASIMAEAEADGLIIKNPCRIKAGRRARVSREPEVLTLAELLRLADEMPQRHRALTLLCGLAGLRYGEAVALRVRDVDLEAGHVRVVRTYLRENGKKVTGEPKTKESQRTVAIPSLVVTELRLHLERESVQDRDALIFSGRDGQLLSPTALYGRSARIERRRGTEYKKSGYGFYAARQAIGKPTLHWHDLRRTAATLGAQSGATVREMQSRLGHATPSMALHYQQATLERDQTIASALQKQIEQLQRKGGDRESKSADVGASGDSEDRQGRRRW
ncbi:site-specific integrase [uncultured Serinicoccus sp.]|uniref:tyrosine-type recombinase/integrase n=1 Tax=uncultured Serinicoccus sp. TaxID=735514 RepID=UPI00262D914F|nr:site-specific integrase [uncultured Serinicoccus sp.]